MHYDAICISDLHLGARNCQVARLHRFLHRLTKGKKLSTDLLIIVGDGLDDIRTSKLKKKHWGIIDQINKLATNIRVVWLNGNHDNDHAVLKKVTEGVDVQEEYVFRNGAKLIHVSHGHTHDTFLKANPTLTHMADTIYGFSQMVDPSHRLAKMLKRRSKAFLKCARKVGFGAAKLAADKGCSVAIHGHNHNCGHVRLEGIDVWDCGCWTEKPCSFLTINNGEIALHYHTDK